MGDDAPTNTVDDGDETDVPAWLDERVQESDIPRDDLVEVAEAAIRAAETDGANTGSDELADRLDDLEAEYDQKLQDVRERVLQVRDIARSNTEGEPAGDQLPELESRIDSLADQQDNLETEINALSASLDRLEDQVDGGFENYETILNDLVERTRRLNSRLDTLARVTRTTRDTINRVAGEQSERTQMESLADAANRAGVRSAHCESCGTSIDIALLTRPSCPECGTTFADVEPARGFFDSATLTTGSPPALAPGEEERSDPIEEMQSDEPTDT